MDEAILLSLNGLRSPLLDGVTGFLGSWGYLAFPLILAALAARERTRASLRSLLDGWLAYLLALFVVESIVKPLVDRPRPSSVEALEGTLHVLGRASSTPSFPSGTATACAAAVAWIALRRRGDRVGQATLIGAALFGIATSLARVVGGAHWPSDILAGWVCGAATAYAIDRLTQPSPAPSA